VSLLLLMVSAGAPPTVPSNASLYLKIAAPFSEVQPLDVLSQFVTQAPTLRGTVEHLRAAARDPRVKTLVILPQAEGALWGQLQEVRGALVEFRQSGKPITAYLEYGGAQEYYLASAADRIVMMPAGQLDLSGLATYELFFRGALDKLGVYPDLLRIGDYKTAANTFTERGFTAAHREMSRALNHDWYEQLVRAIAEGRKRPEADVRKVIDAGPFLAEDAMQAGLVDALSYEDQLGAAPPVQGTRRIDGETYLKATMPPASSGGGRVALLYAVGTITSGKSSFDMPGGQVLGSETFNEWVRKVRVDPSIRAIVVRIDSPGGSAIATEAIWRELMLARDAKPVIVSMGDVAASGGYYMAMPAHVIVAQPGTITGSIGVVAGKFVLKGTFDKLGVGTDAVSDGRLAEMNSPFRPFSKDERTRMEEQIRTTYELFLKRVADGRHQTRAKVDQVAQGRVWTGHQARELNLVDELGGLDTAIQIAKREAKLDPKRDVELVVYPLKRSLYEFVASPFGSSMDLVRMLSRGQDARLIDSAVSRLRLFHRGEMLAVLPDIFFWN
jgi:protease-4